jgi:RNA polymerase sigma-70 factor (ECF subfamily)
LSGDASALQATIDAIYRTEQRRIRATLIRLLGSFELAEEAVQDAFIAAAEQWPRDGIPDAPHLWLISAGRYRAIDRLRRRARHEAAVGEIALLEETAQEPALDARAIADDSLRLVFICCHPALPADAKVALTLREVCGLTTEEIARAFLSSPPTIAQRIVRAKAKIKSERLPYEVPPKAQLADRLSSVLGVIYLLFNEGYSASAGDVVVRRELTGEAIRLGRLLADLLPDPEALGLLALMLLHESRRTARSAPDGEFVALADQDRALWDRELIAEGRALVSRAFASGEVGAYAIEAAIALAHASAEKNTVNWAQVVGLYDLLLKAAPSPVVELNRAVAVGAKDGPLVGLALVEAIAARGALADYRFLHVARADFLEKLGRQDEARAAYAEALKFTLLAPERRFIEKKISNLPSP